MKPKYKVENFDVKGCEHWFTVKKRFLFIFYISVFDHRIPGHPFWLVFKTKQEAENWVSNKLNKNR